MFDPFLYHQNLKSNHRRCSTKKVFLEILQSSQESTCFGVPKFSKTLFFTEHLRETAFIFFSFIKNFRLWWNKCWGRILRNCIFPFFIAGTSFRPWYVRDENAEIEFLRRHKNFLSEIKSYSASSWASRGAFEDLESERDAKLCLSRNSKQLGFFSKCDGCQRKITGIKYRCLVCKDTNLCSICHERRTVPLGHKSFHKMAELK